MTPWSDKIAAHRWTFRVLRSLQLLKKSVEFPAAGPLRMDQLRHWIDGDSPSNRRTRAVLLAAQMHDLYVGVIHAKLVSGVTATAARTKLENDLVKADCTVEKLANDVDAMYTFLEEQV